MSDSEERERRRKKTNRRYAYAVFAIGFLICPFVPPAGIALFVLALFMEHNNADWSR